MKTPGTPGVFFRPDDQRSGRKLGKLPTLDSVIVHAAAMLVSAAMYDQQPAISTKLQRFDNLRCPATNRERQPAHGPRAGVDRSRHGAGCATAPTGQHIMAGEVGFSALRGTQNFFVHSAFRIGELHACQAMMLNLGRMIFKTRHRGGVRGKTNTAEDKESRKAHSSIPVVFLPKGFCRFCGMIAAHDVMYSALAFLNRVAERVGPVRVKRILSREGSTDLFWWMQSVTKNAASKAQYRRHAWAWRGFATQWDAFLAGRVRRHELISASIWTPPICKVFLSFVQTRKSQFYIRPWTRHSRWPR